MEKGLTAAWRSLCCMVLAVILSPMANAETAKPLHMESLSLEQGLSQSAVLTIHQDSVGFMWFGTEDGLNRYDGYTFTHYKRERGSAVGLANDFIFDIAEDRDRNLWIATDGGGVAKWDRATDSFKTYRHDPNNLNSLSSDMVRTLHIDADGAIWIGTRRSGVDRLDPSSGVFTHYRHDAADSASLSSDEVYAITTDRNGRVWIGTDDGLNHFETSTGNFVRYRHDPENAGSLSNDRIRALFVDGQGALWVGTYAGLNRFDGEASGFTRYQHVPGDASSLSYDKVVVIFEDADARLWVGTSKGLNFLDRVNARFKRYRSDAANPFSLSDDYIMSLHQDRTGVLWVGTKSGGVNKWNPATWSMGHHVADPEAAERLDNPNVTSFAQEASGELWVGTFGSGLKRMNRVTEKVIHFRHDPSNVASLSDDFVMSLLRSAKGELWVGTMNGGLNRLNPVTGAVERFVHDPADPASLSANGVMSLLEDTQGNIWAGTFGGGLNKLDPQTNAITRFNHDPANPSSLSSPRATAIAEDRSGAFWVGTDGGGLNLLDPKSGVFHQYRDKANDPTSLSDNTVYSLHVDATGTVWVGTRGGLNRVIGSASEPGSIRFETLSEKSGLDNESIYGIRSTSDGNLWLSTNYGLARFNPGTGEVRNFHRRHGLQSEEFNFGAHYISAKGELFFGGPNGFNAFHPGQLETNTAPPPIVLTSIEGFDGPIKSDIPVDQLEEIEFGFGDDVLGFEFAALDFVAPEANRYAYMLEGFNDEWIELGNHRRITFTDLNDGRYTLRVRAANSDGVWNEAGFSLAMRILPAPWDTWWAYVLYAAAAALMVMTPYRAQQRRLAREAEYNNRLEKEVRVRTRALADRNGELETANNKLLQASLTDPLTGLRNRRFLFEEALKDTDLIRRQYRDAKAGSKRKATSDLLFVMVDLDHFKPVNDQFGHAAGDQMLLQVRDVLLDVCRSSDFVVRWGGDEFLVVARNANQKEAEALAERIRSRIADTAYVLDSGEIVRTTCSIGFACYPFVRTNPELLSWEQVINLADKAMYEAKKIRNAWVGFLSTSKTAGSEGTVPESIPATAHLFEAVQQGRLELRASREVASPIQVLFADDGDDGPEQSLADTG